MFLTRPSVSQSVGSVFFIVSATPLKPLNSINLVVKDKQLRCAYPQEIPIQFFLSEFLNLEF